MRGGQQWEAHDDGQCYCGLRFFYVVRHQLALINVYLCLSQEGVFVHGMFLDGAGWDRRNLRLCEATLKVLYTALPVVHVYAINSTAPKDPKLYQVCRKLFIYDIA